MKMKLDVAGALRRAIGDVLGGDASMHDLFSGLLDYGKPLTYGQVIENLILLLARGTRTLPHAGRSTTPPPWAELDPGIVEVVRMFWEQEFRPTDSGDGVSKLKGGAEDYGPIIPRPHVVLRVEPEDLIAETRRCRSVLEEAGIPLGVDDWTVEGSFDGAVAVIMVMGPEPKR